jgi:predicted DNA-binding transcriptional regulator AlpA
MADQHDTLKAVPTLNDLARNPALALELRPDVAMQLHIQAVMILSALTPCFSRSNRSSPLLREDGDCLIGVAEVAALIGMSLSWVEKHTKVLPPRVSVEGNPKWRKSEIDRWVKTRPRYGSA